MEACLVVLVSCDSLIVRFVSEEIKRKEGLDRKNKNLKKTIKCALTPATAKNNAVYIIFIS